MNEPEIEAALLLAANTLEEYGHGGKGYFEVDGREFYSLLDLVTYINEYYELIDSES